MGRTVVGKGIKPLGPLGWGIRSLAMALAVRIMVVDDEETICEALKAWFLKDGHQVATALSGSEALGLMQDSPCDIYIIDVKMPGMDGIELLSRLKDSPGLPVVPAVCRSPIAAQAEYRSRAADRSAMDGRKNSSQNTGQTNPAGSLAPRLEK